MLTKDPEMLQPDALQHFWQRLAYNAALLHTMQQNATVAGADPAGGAYSAPTIIIITRSPAVARMADRTAYSRRLCKSCDAFMQIGPAVFS